MADPVLDTDSLIQLANRGEIIARERLLTRHRPRLKRMIALRLDRRMAGRVDASDVVQESLFEASKKLDDYLQSQPLPFYPWLRQIAVEKLIKLHERHVLAGKRSVIREDFQPALDDESLAQLARKLASPSDGPAERASANERHECLRRAMDKLRPRDRELLLLRFFERLSVADAAAVLRISPQAVKTGQFRAIERLRLLLESELGSSA